MTGSGTAESSRANSSHSQRPAAMPSGTPMITPTTATTVDCQAMAPASWRRVKPSVFSRARSRRRRRTDATRVSPRAATVPAATPPARITGIVPMDL